MGSNLTLEDEELTEIRASQRTFEGAYVRTALGQFSFALVVLKIFTSEFYSIGALFSLYGAGVLFTSVYRRQLGHEQFFSEIEADGRQHKKFKTCGAIVLLLTVLTVVAYVILLVLLLRLDG